MAAEPTASPFTGRTFDRRQFSQAKSAGSHFIRLSFPISCCLSFPLSDCFPPALMPSFTLPAPSSLFNRSPPLSLFFSLSASFSYFWSQLHQLFMSLHGLSDWSAINKSYQGHHITPERPPVTHRVPHEDACTCTRPHTHTHTHTATTQMHTPRDSGEGRQVLKSRFSPRGCK